MKRGLKGRIDKILARDIDCPDEEGTKISEADCR